MYHHHHYMSKHLDVQSVDVHSVHKHVYILYATPDGIIHVMVCPLIVDHMARSQVHDDVDMEEKQAEEVDMETRLQTHFPVLQTWFCENGFLSKSDPEAIPVALGPLGMFQCRVPPGRWRDLYPDEPTLSMICWFLFHPSHAEIYSLRLDTADEAKRREQAKEEDEDDVMNDAPLTAEQYKHVFNTRMKHVYKRSK
jgi:hypothetical protein